MEGPDRPVFPEIIPVGMGLPGFLFPQALKPFPDEPQPPEEPEAGEDINP